MQASFAIGQHQAVTLRFDEAFVNGYGAAVTPRLLIQARVDVSFPQIGPNRKIEFLRMSMRLDFGNQLFLDALPASLSLSVASARPTFPDQLVTLEFPMSPAIVAALEARRNGGNLRANFWATLEFQDLRAASAQPQAETWVLAQRQRASTSGQFEFPSSAWISRVLPNIGFGVIHVVEFPAVPIEEYENFKEAFKALGQARERHLAGLYDDVAAKCRIALDKFFEPIEVLGEDGKPKKVPKLKSSWETKLGKATFEWLDSSLSAVKKATNPSHHSPNEHFDQLESQLLLAVTTALVAYAARSGSDKGDDCT